MSRSSGVSTRSTTRIGCTPLSDTFHATRFSQIDWKRSSANVSIRMRKSVVEKLRSTALATGDALFLTRPMASDLAPELALISAGEFLMGSDDAEEDERPVHCVHVDDFFLGVQPVTNAEYARFVRDTGHRSPAVYELPIVVKAGGSERERRSEEHTSELQSLRHLVCRLLLEKKKHNTK